jgi:hypothetical protein
MPDYSNHSELQDDLVEYILGAMDLKVLEQYVREDLHYHYKSYSYEELLVEADDHGLDVQELIPPETNN